MHTHAQTGVCCNASTMTKQLMNESSFNMTTDHNDYDNNVTSDDVTMCEEYTDWGGFKTEFAVVLASYGVIGFLGNLLVLLVYGKSQNRGLSHSVYVFTLGFIDFTGE
jgi:hypothetical protein